MSFIRCGIYLFTISMGLFLLGRVVPAGWIHPEAFPFAPFSFERDGKVYERIRIKSWQNKVPDMSKVFPGIIPPKKMGRDFRHRMPEMIRETCIAELIHFILPFLGFYCIRLWTKWGWLMALLYALGNQPFIWIQRYNRPKFVRVYRKIQNNAKEAHQRGGAPARCEL